MSIKLYYSAHKLNASRTCQTNSILQLLDMQSRYLIKEKSVDFKDTIQVIMENKDIIVENLLRLTFLYFGIFGVQALILPLLIFWFLLKIVNSLFVSTAITTTGNSIAPGEVAT